MAILRLLNQISLVLGIVSLIFTIVQIFYKLKIKKLQEELVSKIITMMELKKSDQEIINILVADEWDPEEISVKIGEIRQLTKFNSNQAQKNQE